MAQSNPMYRRDVSEESPAYQHGYNEAYAIAVASSAQKVAGSLALLRERTKGKPLSDLDEGKYRALSDIDGYHRYCGAQEIQLRATLARLKRQGSKLYDVALWVWEKRGFGVKKISSDSTPSRGRQEPRRQHGGRYAC